MADVTEVADGIFRICVYVTEFELSFNQYLVRDEAPLLFHTGMNGIYEEVRDAVSRVVEPSRLRWIAFSHFESDECGSLNRWLGLAREAQPACSFVGAMVNVNDYASRPAKPLREGDVIDTGSHRLRFLSTPHVPHAWDAGMLFDESTRSLFCSDILHQEGRTAAVTRESPVESFRDMLTEYQRTPFTDYMPLTTKTRGTLQRVAALEPERLLIMHGAAYEGDGGRALRDAAEVMQEVLDST